MNDVTIGTILASLRSEKRISRKKPCQGLCSSQMLIKIENDKADVDVFLLNMLLERLGKSPEKLEIILSDEENQKLLLRDKIEELIWKNDYKLAYGKLAEYENKYVKDSNVQKMFVLRSKAYICRYIEKNIAQTEVFIRQAIDMTIPNINFENMNEYLIAGIEMENLIELGRCFFEQGRCSEAEILVDACQKYVDDRVTDEIERAKLCSKSLWLKACILNSKKDYIHAYQQCEKVLEPLSRYGIYLMFFLIITIDNVIKNEHDFSVTNNL